MLSLPAMNDGVSQASVLTDLARHSLKNRGVTVTYTFASGDTEQKGLQTLSREGQMQVEKIREGNILYLEQLEKEDESAQHHFH